MTSATASASFRILAILIFMQARKSSYAPVTINIIAFSTPLNNLGS